MKRILVSDGKVYVADERWVTIGGEDEDGSGQHVLIKENGTIVAGFGTGKNVRNAFGGSEKSSNGYESKARESVEYWLKTHYKTESDKNIKESVESVRSQMEYRLKGAEKNLRDAKSTGKPELIKEYQDKYDEAKGMLDALNKYYDGGEADSTAKKSATPRAPRKTFTGKPVDVSKFKFTDYRNAEGGQYSSNFKTYRSTFETMARQIEKDAERCIHTYWGETPPAKQFMLDDTLRKTRPFRDMLSPSDEKGAKDCEKAIYKRWAELYHQLEKYTKWDSKKGRWVKERKVK